MSCDKSIKKTWIQQLTRCKCIYFSFTHTKIWFYAEFIRVVLKYQFDDMIPKLRGGYN